MAGNGDGDGDGGKILVTFDVDGTLMRSVGPLANRLHKRAFSHAMEEIFGVRDATIDVVKHHGSTDPIILVSTLEHYGVPRQEATAKLPELKASMVGYAHDHASEIGDGLELLPGVYHLLQTLSKDESFLIGLVTGNLEGIAWMKMVSLGIEEFFSVPHFGGFGSDHEDRGELVKLSRQKALQLFDKTIRLHAHVGDTPNDVAAAELGGALPVAVCTGIFTGSELRQASGTNAVILNDLTNAEAFLAIFGGF
ncbi:uncharacterized protein LOC112342237 [Selaginella moellendorffii]|uniref:uncharacterized protein LOC112342237 n=1 Tax=Selaginella moellendorffii TaxID=88036 RepID=UPI000D1C6994|nr:uncharacterized protein LOC112342237 [Selaginella moellendorffii]|eukprot:XP_024519524.1 uncharacterized protein LOC112342237 [Selaginella moellendorffii]